MKKLVKEKLDFQRGMEPKKALDLGMTPKKQRDFVLEKLVAMEIAQKTDVFTLRERMDIQNSDFLMHILEDAPLPGAKWGKTGTSFYYIAQIFSDSGGIGSWTITDPWERESNLFDGDWKELIEFIANHLIKDKEKDIDTANKTLQVLEKDIKNIKSIKESI